MVQKHQHLQMLHLLVLLQEPEDSRRKPTVKSPIGVHLHLQDHHRKRFAAAGVMAGPEHANEKVSHLFEGDRPEGVGRFGVHCAFPACGQPGQELKHQIGQGSEHLGVQVVAWQRD